MLSRTASPLHIAVSVLGALSALSMTNAMSVEDAGAVVVKDVQQGMAWVSEAESWVSKEEAWLTKEVKEEMESVSGYKFHHGPPTPIQVPTCDMKDGKCSMEKIRSSENTVIYPGKDTQCIDPNTPFYFQVMPGEGKGVLIYFAAGGACWSSETNAIGSCYGDDVLASVSPEVVQGPYHGVFDKSNPRNPFADYTIVSISYCSGDVHAGDNIITYDNMEYGLSDVVVRQAGKNNTMAALSWIKDNIPAPDKVVVMGCSSGAIGAELWGGYISDMYSNNEAPPATAVVADSYAGIFPSSQAQLFEIYKIAHAPFTEELPKDLLDKLRSGNIYYCELTDALHKLHPEVSYLPIQSKADLIQTLFYDAVTMSLGDGPEVLHSDAPKCVIDSIPPPHKIQLPDNFFKAVGGMYRSYSSTSNFAPYLVNSMYHCFTCFDRFYTTEIRVNGNHFWNKPKIALVDWINQATLPEAGVNADLTGKCEVLGFHEGGNWIQAVMFAFLQCPSLY